MIGMSSPERRTSYLRAYRQRWGLSQKDLAELLGLADHGVISRIEKGARYPSIRVALGCFILFGTQATELFPSFFNTVEAGILDRAWDLYERMQGHPTARTRAKIELLEDVIERAKQRNSQV